MDQRLKVRKLLKSIVLIFGFACCTDSKIIVNSICDQSKLDSDKCDILTKLDSSKYYSILKERDMSLLNFDNLYYSMLMCEKANNKHACFDCYRILSGSINPVELKFNPLYFRKLSLYFLFKAKKIGHESARFEVQNLFPEGVPDSIFLFKLNPNIEVK